VSFTKENLSGAKGLSVLKPRHVGGTGFEMRRYRTDDEPANATCSRRSAEQRFYDFTTAIARRPWKEPPQKRQHNSRALGATEFAVNFPLPAKVLIFVRFLHRLSCEHMKNKQKKGGGASQEKQSKVTSLPRMEMYAVLGLELGQRIFEKLEKVEDSLDILAAQKARELNPEKSDAETAS
jgi:hypothetical protein